ncbi:MAG: hypothetical protein R8K22_08330 [Mariprofundaceae bacterium]
MNIAFENAPWGMFFAAALYVLGNGVWANCLVRKRLWVGWILWSILGCFLLVVAALFETRLDVSASMGVWERLSSVNVENHWIALSLLALLSVPGAASVLFKQNVRWTQLAILLPAIIIFIPLGQQLNHPTESYLGLSLGVTLAVCGLMIAWQMLLDCDPEQGSHQKEKTA